MKKLLIIAALGFFLSGCNEQHPADADHSSTRTVAEPAPYSAAVSKGMAVPMEMAGMDSPAPSEAIRHIAEKQFWVVEAKADRVLDTWAAHQALCTGNCEVVSATSSSSDRAFPHAALSLRVPRDMLPGVTRGLETGGTVIERGVTREDRSMEVVDTEARVTALTGLRDRIQTMLNTRHGGLKDVLEMERELARVQGELDATLTRKKVLARETEKVEIQVSYRATPTAGAPGTMQPIADAWHESAAIFSRSVAAAIRAFVFFIPWAVLVAATVAGFKLGRRWSRARAGRNGT